MRPRLTLCLLVLLAAAGTAAAAIDETSEETIQPDEWFYYGLEVTEEGPGASALKVPLVVTVEVLSGPSVNVYLVDEDNFEALQAGDPFVTVGDIERRNTRSYTASAKLGDVGVYYLVVDNHDHANDAPADGPTRIRYGIGSTDVRTSGAPGLGAFALLGVLGLALAARRWA